MDSMITNSVEVNLNKQINGLTVKFLGYISFDDFLKVVEFEYELIRNNNLKKAIIDLRQIPVYASGMPEYVKDTWFPTVSKLGLQFIGFVQPESALGNISMKKAHQDTQSVAGITVANFKETEDALEWIKTV